MYTNQKTDFQRVLKNQTNYKQLTRNSLKIQYRKKQSPENGKDSLQITQCRVVNGMSVSAAPLPSPGAEHPAISIVYTFETHVPFHVSGMGTGGGPSPLMRIEIETCHI